MPVCVVCGEDLGWARPSGVCSERCLRVGQGWSSLYKARPYEDLNGEEEDWWIDIGGEG